MSGQIYAKPTVDVLEGDPNLTADGHRNITGTSMGTKRLLDSISVPSLVAGSGYDYILLTYVAAGNGIGEISTVTFKTGGSGGTTVGLLTLVYDANDKLSTVTRTAS